MTDESRTGQIHAASPSQETGERTLSGIGVAPGIAIGRVSLYVRDSFDAEERSIGEDGVEEELARFERAVSRSERDLKKISSIAREKLGEGSAEIFEAQALMLRDAALYEAVAERIRRERHSAEWAVQAVIGQHSQRMSASDNEYMRERVNDFIDLKDRIIRHLRRGQILSNVEPDRIIIAENLTAADIILFSRRSILGCAMDYGGPTSHVSIMARALGVPAIVSMHGVTEHVADGSLVVLDGFRGHVVADPSDETLDRARIRQRRYERLLQEQKHIVPLEPETLDGHRVRLRANLEFREELPLLKEYGAEGIGLFRTEVLVLMQRRLSLSEEEQYRVYRDVVERVGPPGTTFRMLDLGGDKMLPMGHREHNPFLGWRGIRVLLDKPDLLGPQLRAILRASAHGPVRLLLPMVTDLDEVRRFRTILEDQMDVLRAEGQPFEPDVPLGIMVEVPAVALLAEQFAPEVDFFSIGTNDLTQYTLAVDRGNDLVADKYQELHPAVLSLIHRSVEAAHRHGIYVSLCGELGGNPRATPLLVGLGLDELSASPTYLPEVKRMIRALTLEEARALAREALAAPDARGVEALLGTWLEDHSCGLLDLLADHAAGHGEASEGHDLSFERFDAG